MTSITRSANFDILLEYVCDHELSSSRTQASYSKPAYPKLLCPQVIANKVTI